MIPYDDDVDIVILRKDLPKFKQYLDEIREDFNVYRYFIPINNFSLYYKIYPKRNALSIVDHSYEWPFIDIFICDYDEKNNTLYDISDHHTFHPVSANTIPITLSGYGEETKHKKYYFRVFKDYLKMLDVSYGKNWRQVCITSDYDHRTEYPTPFTSGFHCKNILTDYSEDDSTSDSLDSLNPLDKLNPLDSLDSLDTKPHYYRNKPVHEGFQFKLKRHKKPIGVVLILIFFFFFVLYLYRRFFPTSSSQKS
jgi:hypothetical protein